MLDQTDTACNISTSRDNILTNNLHKNNNNIATSVIIIEVLMEITTGRTSHLWHSYEV